MGETGIDRLPVRRTNQMRRNLERAAEHEDMTEELATVLSTPLVTVEHRIETGLEIK